MEPLLFPMSADEVDLSSFSLSFVLLRDTELKLVSS